MFNLSTAAVFVNKYACVIFPRPFICASISAMKRFWIIAGIVVGVIILAILIVPLFINVDSFRPDIEQKLSTSLGRTVHIGKIQASLFSGGARADNISISDDPAFNKGPFLQASSLQIGLQCMPLF